MDPHFEIESNSQDTKFLYQGILWPGYYKDPKNMSRVCRMWWGYKKNVNVTKIFGYKNYNLDRNNMYMIKILN